LVSFFFSDSAEFLLKTGHSIFEKAHLGSHGARIVRDFVHGTSRELDVSLEVQAATLDHVVFFTEMRIFVDVSLQVIFELSQLFVFFSKRFLENSKFFLVVFIVALESTLVPVLGLELRFQLAIFLLDLVETLLSLSEDGLEARIFVIRKHFSLESSAILTQFELFDHFVKFVIVFL